MSSSNNAELWHDGEFIAAQYGIEKLLVKASENLPPDTKDFRLAKSPEETGLYQIIVTWNLGKPGANEHFFGYAFNEIGIYVPGISSLVTGEFSDLDRHVSIRKQFGSRGLRFFATRIVISASSTLEQDIIDPQNPNEAFSFFSPKGSTRGMKEHTTFENLCRMTDTDPEYALTEQQRILTKDKAWVSRAIGEALQNPRLILGMDLSTLKSMFEGNRHFLSYENFKLLRPKPKPIQPQGPINIIPYLQRGPTDEELEFAAWDDEDRNLGEDHSVIPAHEAHGEIFEGYDTDGCEIYQPDQ